MTAAKWQQVDEIFKAALERAPDERADFLRRACAGDEALLRELESLLGSYEQAGSFMEAPAMATVAHSLLGENGESPVGRLLGHYRVIRLLGEGGMGQVYLAEDTKLGRQVALKLLPRHFGETADRLRRFAREARAASSLNHPNVCVIHEVGETAEGSPYIVMEYVEGVTLRQHVGERQPALSEALDISIQVAAALAAAHEVGVIHRDIKSDNVMLRPDGLVKVLDFGLAKLTEQQRASDSGLPTQSLVRTETGMVMGTAAYMSPEQARGLEVDHRTDIWSLGVMLYEMVAGRLPFEGDTTSDIIASILKSEPAQLSEYSEGVPTELQRIAVSALRKEREERYESAKDLLADLRSLKQELEFQSNLGHAIQQGLAAEASGESGREDAAREKTRKQEALPASSIQHFVSGIKRDKRGAPLILAALAVASVIAFGLYRFTDRRQSGTKPVASFQTMKISKLTNNGKVNNAAISHDGKYLVYSILDAGKESLWLRQVAAPSSAQLAPPAANVFYDSLVFSHDNNYIYYAGWDREGVTTAIYRVPMLGGTARKLLTTGIWGTITLSPDDKQCAFVRGDYPSRDENALIVANLDGSGEHELAVRRKPDFFPTGFFIGPAWSPDGKVIACPASYPGSDGTSMNVVEVRVSDGTVRPISSRRWPYINQVAWLADGSGLILSTSDKGPYGPFQLWYVSYPDGEARRVTNDLNNYRSLSLTADSAALVTVQAELSPRIWLVPDGDTGRARQISSEVSGVADYWGFSWTPDGRIVYESTAGGNQDIWIMDQDGSNQRQLTASAGSNFDPEVTPDGRYIVFASTRAGASNIWRMDIDGSNPIKLTSGKRDFVPSCSPDGRWVVYTSGDQEVEPAALTLWKVAIDGGEAVRLTDKETWWPSVSPDGKLIACFYWSGNDSRHRIAVIPFEGGEPVKILNIAPTVNTWAELRWTPDGRALTYIDARGGPQNIWSQPIDGGPPKQVTDFKSDGIFRYEWSRDGKQLVCSRGSQLNDVVMISNF